MSIYHVPRFALLIGIVQINNSQVHRELGVLMI